MRRSRKAKKGASCRVMLRAMPHTSIVQQLSDLKENEIMKKGVPLQTCDYTIRHYRDGIELHSVNIQVVSEK